MLEMTCPGKQTIDSMNEKTTLEKVVFFMAHKSVQRLGCKSN
ncbi:hypothetical protein A33Q_1016 [Indibacter alkaliphilus LW1]|uniref:Uncharacterized protein n=1 Tax=Indibacter alkaliphilus (strain CCUG 57479 / KCTC 22604 / LW1) TaxID=1189612 RepID=S2DH56_INDAL|nr:hypothetical protein A33Q_1016 [Indibacter alkaliphilus LW1]